MLAGDYNIDLLKINEHGPSQDFLNIMNSESFLPTINSPTRISSHSATIIDNIYVNCIHDITEPTIVVSDFSDHFPLVMWLKTDYAIATSKQPCSQKIIKDTLINQFSHALGETNWLQTYQKIINDTLINQFSHALGETNWLQTYSALSEGDVNTAYKSFIAEYKTIYDKTFTTVCKGTQKVMPKKIWMTQGLLVSCKRKNKLYLKSIKHPTEANIISYRKYRNKFKTLKNNMERQYYEREFAKNLHNSKNTWRLVKSLLNANCASNTIDALKLDGRIVTDPAQLAHAFNGFFTGIGRTLAQKIPQGQKNSR